MTPTELINKSNEISDKIDEIVDFNFEVNGKWYHVFFDTNESYVVKMDDGREKASAVKFFDTEKMKGHVMDILNGIV